MLRSYPQHEVGWGRTGIWVWVLFVLLLLPWGFGLGQGLPSAIRMLPLEVQRTTPPADATAAPAVTPPPVPVDPLGRTSPHGTVLGFLRAAEEKDYTKAAKFLDGKRSPEQATELVVQLKYLLDQGLSTSLDDISRSPQKDVEDEHRVTRERIGLRKDPGW